jgi:hypothetical protein
MMSDRARSLCRRAIPPRLRHLAYSARYFWRECASVDQLAAGAPTRVWLFLVRVLLCVKHELPSEALRRVAIPVWTTAAGRILLRHLPGESWRTSAKGTLLVWRSGRAPAEGSLS